MRDYKGFTPLLKFALGGLISVREAMRTFGKNLRESFHLSPAPHGARANSSAGFTLIELLVVVAIIGLLSSVVLSSLSGARRKGRDARRLMDLQQMQTGLELYYSEHTAYPVSTTQSNAATALIGLTPANMSTIPDDPLGGSYHYVYKTTADGNFYCLGSIFEGTPIPVSTCNTISLGSALSGVQYVVGP